MTIMSFLPRVKQIVSTGGSGNLVLGAAASGFQALGAGQNAAQLPYYIEDGTAWEEGTLVYTHSGTTVARTFKASSTGSALTVSVGAYVYIGMTADLFAAHDLAMQAFITGLVVTKGSGNTINISAGACFVPAAGKIVSYAGGTNVAVGTLGASQWNQVFLSEAGAIQVTNNADPPSTTYAGSARQGGTNSNRRWIAPFLTDGSSNVRSIQASEFAPGLVIVQYVEDINSGAPFRVLSAGGATSFTSVSLAGIAPRYAASDVLFNAYITTGSGGTAIGLSNDGVSLNIGTIQAPPVSIGSAFLSTILWAPPERSTPQIYYSVGSGQSAYLDVAAYKVAR